MARSEKHKHTSVWLSVVILLVCVAATSITYFNRLDGFLLDDDGAIALVPEASSKENNGVNGTESAQSSDTSSATAPDSSDIPSFSTASSSNVATTREPGFTVGEETTVWSTSTGVELFRVSYENGEQVITVNSENGDKLIAPGTENSYTFKLKNTGNTAISYTVELEAYVTPSDMEIPINGRLNRYDGMWIVGGEDDYRAFSELDSANDKAILGVGKYTYYTLDWVWPFESGDDSSDTFFGNLATEEELTFTVIIKTTAKESYYPYDDSGLMPPQTGDNSNLALWVAVAVVSLTVLLLTVGYRKSKGSCSTEADGK